MTIVKHELRQGRTAFAVWTAAIALLLMLCVFIFPETRADMDAMGELFASMGGFTAAFGMDRLNMGTLTGFYAIECGNVLGLGGAFFASLAGISMLAKEERDKTAEFLLTHPVSRARAVTEKLAALLIQITAMNLLLIALSLGSIRLIGERVPWKEVMMIHGAYYLLQLELACVCFGLSAYLRRGGAGLGIGLAAAAYLLNLIANMTGRAKLLKYVTPFGYCEGADILAAGGLDAKGVAIGLLFAGAGIAAAYWRYTQKDIR